MASALITLDGTATTVALPAIGRDLSMSIARLRWIVNAPLLVLAALLLPAGTLADRFGGDRLIRIGLVILAVASLACSIAQFEHLIIAARFTAGVGAVLATAGIGCMGIRSHPLPFWSHIVLGTSLFGLGISLTVSALTHAAIAAVLETCAGAASGLNHAVVRAAGLLAIALLGSIAAPGVSDVVSAEGVQRAMIVCASVVGIGGICGSMPLRDEAPGGLSAG